MNKQPDESTAPSDPGQANRDPKDVAPLPLVASRRRLFRGVAGGAGVLLAVSSKTALGTGLCQSPSAMMSGNTSPRPGSGTSCSGGRSPGFWKVPQHFANWGTTGAIPATFKVPVSVCAAGMQGLSKDDIDTHGTLLTSIGFAGAPAGVGMWAVLAFPNEYQGGQLMRHLAAAWLNAGYFTGATAKYPLTKEQVVAMWNATKSGGTYCPPSIGGCGTNGWTASQVIAYIEGMYDFNSPVEPNLCKP